MTLIHLEAGRLQLTLAPATGGAIVDWTVDGMPLLRPTDPADLGRGEAFRLGSYPLVPYSNRIADGRFRFEDRAYELALNFGERPHSIHGIGWQREWSVLECQPGSAVLALEHDPAVSGTAGWPFKFRAEQTFLLTDDKLSILMRLENNDRRRMPAGIGQHPYFPRTPGVELQFSARAVWHNGPDYLPSERTAVPAEWSYQTGRGLGWPGLDNCFEGWNGRARIVWPERRLALGIEADPVFGHCVVFTPSGQDFFAFEPVSHMNDAVNRMETAPGHGMVILEPGEALQGRMEMRVDRL